MMISHFVIAGLDPAIHAAALNVMHISMDARVRPGHDRVAFASSPARGEGKGVAR